MSTAATSSDEFKPYQERPVDTADPRRPECVTRSVFVSPKKGDAERLPLVLEIIRNYRAYVIVKGAQFADASRLPPGGVLIRNLELTKRMGGTDPDRNSHRFMHVEGGIYEAIRAVMHTLKNNEGEQATMDEDCETLTWMLQAVSTLHLASAEDVDKFATSAAELAVRHEQVRNERKAPVSERLAMASEIKRTESGKIWNTPMKAPLVWSSEHRLSMRKEDLLDILRRVHPTAVDLTKYLDKLLRLCQGCENYLHGLLNPGAIFKDRKDKLKLRRKEAVRLKNGGAELLIPNVKPFLGPFRATEADMRRAAEHLEASCEAAEAGEVDREESELELARGLIERARREMLLVRLYRRKLEGIFLVISQIVHGSRDLEKTDCGNLIAQLSEIRDRLRDDGLDKGFKRPFLENVVASLDIVIELLEYDDIDIEEVYEQLKDACDAF